MKPALICLHVVLPADTFFLGFHLRLSSGLHQSYMPVRYRPIKYVIIGATKCGMPRTARTAGPPLAMNESTRYCCD